MYAIRSYYALRAAGEGVFIGAARLGDLSSLVGAPRLYLDLDQGVLLLAAVELVEVDFDPVAADAPFAADDAQGADPLRTVDLDDHLPSGYAQHVAKLGGEDPRQVTTRLDEVVVAVSYNFV